VKLSPVVIRIIGHRWGVAALVVLALPSLYGVAELTRPSGRATEAVTRAGRVAVQSAVAVCPAVDGARLGVLSPGRGGRTEVSALPSGATVAGPLGGGSAWVQDEHGTGTVEVRANGASAAGLEAEQTGLERTGDDKGLAGERCPAPGTDAWFLGPGPLGAKQIVLTLTDADDQPAIVDVQGLSDIGPLVSAEVADTSVEPGTSQQIVIGSGPAGLAPIVGSAQLLALHVHAVSGRVAASLRVRVDTGKGLDWEPQAAPASTRLVVPAVPGGAGQRQLLVAVPGTTAAKIQVRVVTASGMQPQGGPQPVDCPGQTITAVPLDSLLSGQPAAVSITSDQPVFAGVSAAQGGDVAYGAATGALDGTGGVVADEGAAGVTDTLVLTAPETAARVRLTTVTGSGPQPNPQEVPVGAGRTLSVALTPGDSGLLVQPEPGSGPVHAGRVLTGPGGMITVLPVAPALKEVVLPPVANTLTSLVP
jgi:hypothetical protein